MFKSAQDRSVMDVVSTAQRTFSTVELCYNIPEITVRKLQWWDEMRLISPRRQGHRRIWEADDIIEVLLICELRRKGFTFAKAKRILKAVQGKLAAVFTSAEPLFLLTDGKNTQLQSKPTAIFQELERARSPLALVSVSAQKFRIDRFQPCTSNPRFASAKAARFSARFAHL
jgi:DNA-binding transcriptional MerR regulator